MVLAMPDTCCYHAQLNTMFRHMISKRRIGWVNPDEDEKWAAKSDVPVGKSDTASSYDLPHGDGTLGVSGCFSMRE